MIPWRWNEAEGEHWEWNCNFPCICPLKLFQRLTYNCNCAFNLRILWAFFPPTMDHDHQCSDPPFFFKHFAGDQYCCWSALAFRRRTRQRHVNLVSNDMLTTFLVAPENAGRETVCWQIWRKLGKQSRESSAQEPISQFRIPLEFLCDVASLAVQDVGQNGGK